MPVMNGSVLVLADFVFFVNIFGADDVYLTIVSVASVFVAAALVLVCPTFLCFACKVEIREIGFVDDELIIVFFLFFSEK